MIFADAVDVTAAPNLWSLIVNGTALAVLSGGFFTGKLPSPGEVKRLETALTTAQDAADADRVEHQRQVAELHRQIEAERAEYRRIIEAKDGQLSTLNAAMADKVIPVAAQSLLVLQQLAYRSPGGS